MPVTWAGKKNVMILLKVHKKKGPDLSGPFFLKYDRELFILLFLFWQQR